MGIKITNLTEVVMAFDLIDRNVNRECRDAMVAVVKKIVQDTKRFAPVDKHRLEKAVKLLPSRGNQYSLHMTIAVEGTVNGRDVDEYAAIVHEYPWNKRGPLTRMKGPKAGPRYLTRAVEKNKKEMMEALAAAMNTGIAKGISRSNVNRKKRRR